MGLASEMGDERDLSYLQQNGINKIYTSKIFLTKNHTKLRKILYWYIIAWYC